MPALVNLATAYAQLERHADAEATLRRALRLEPGYAGAHANLGTVLVLQGRQAEAVGPLEHAVALDPDLMPAQYYLALALAQSGQPTAARARVEAWLNAHPGDTRFEELRRTLR